MRLLDRYLLRELLVPLGYCLSGFLLLWITVDLVNELGGFQARNLRPGDIAEYYLVEAPGFLVLGLPVALLLALLYTLTNLARHHEITAIRAAGVSLWRLCVPYLAVGFVSSLALFALNEFYVPDSSDRAEQIRNRRSHVTASRSRDVEFVNSRDQRIWRIGLYDPRTGEMIKPIVISTQPDSSRITLYADRAVRRNGVWVFYNSEEHKEPAQPDLLPFLLLRTNVLVQPAFTETPEEIRSELRISNPKTLGTVRQADLPIKEIINYLRLHPHPAQAAALYTKLYGRLATPWTCLVVVLIAIPFGAPSGRRNVFVGVASSILIFFAYYVLQQVCLASGAGGYIPAWIAGWFPNAAFGLTGLYLTARVR
ncbi:MAG TPA: LptF/LptG family permease [Verrucomicrobiae bacterium]|nr:LptF/LptG family permease [Verrucomicrobiae bacterium]